MDLKKPHPSRLVEWVQTQNRLVPNLCVVDQNLSGISWEWGAPAPHQAPQLRVQVPGRLVLTTSGCNNQQRLSRCKELLEPQSVPLKEPTHRLIYLDLLPLSSGTGVAAWKALVIYREKLKGLESRPAEAIVPFLNPPPTELASWCHIWDSTNLANIRWPPLDIARVSSPHNLWPT